MVCRIQKSDLSKQFIAVGTAPRGIAVDSTYVWVSNYDSNNVMFYHGIKGVDALLSMEKIILK